MSTAHAPTPYRVEPYVDGIDILDANGVPVLHLADRKIATDGMPPENARFIVRACNAHDDLRAACRELVRWDDGEDTEGLPDVFNRLEDIVCQARAAIAKAEGREATP